MASLRAWLQVLVAFALMAGGFMEGVSGTSKTSFVRRQLADVELAKSDFVSPAKKCRITCEHIFPDCCQNNLIPGFPPVGYFCVNNQNNLFHCGKCGHNCIPSGYTVGATCCSGKCTNLFNDPHNCGMCGNKCRGKRICERGFCEYDDKY